MGDGTLRIGYYSAFDFVETSAITASSTATGYDPTNVRDRLRFMRWKSEVSGDLDTQWVQVDTGPTLIEGEVLQVMAATTGGSWVLARRPIAPGSIHITEGSDIDATDDGAGNITGTGITAGSVNYTSGAIVMTFDAPYSGPLLADYEYGAVLPDYLVLTDFRNTLAWPYINLLSGWDGITFDQQVTVPVEYSRGVTWIDLEPVNDATHYLARRFYRLDWGDFSGNTGRQITLTNVLLGRALVLSEGMAQGVDPGAFDVVGKSTRTRAGVYLGCAIDPPKRHFKATVGPAGLDLHDFDEGELGLQQAPSLDTYLTAYHANKRPVAIRWDGPQRMVAWGNPDGTAATGHVAPLRRALKVQWELDPDRYGVRDK